MAPSGATPDDEGMSDNFNITVRLRRELRTKMGLCFSKGQVIQVRHSPEERSDEGFKILSEGYSAIHPLYEDGKNEKVTVFIPLNWVDVLVVA